MPTRTLEHYAQRVTRLPRVTKMSIAVAVDLLALPLVFLLSVALRRASLSEALAVSPWLVVACPILCVSLFAAFGMYRTVFRFISRIALFKAALAVLVSAVSLGVFNSLFMHSPISM